MQPRNWIQVFIFPLLILCHTRCTKHANGIPGPAGAAGQAGANGSAVKPSAITGYVELFDQYNNAVNSSAGVSLSTTNGNALVTATTDSTGKFSLPPLPPGNYDIHITKPGFDSLKIFVSHSGGDEAKFIGGTRLYQSLTTKITGQSLVIQNSFGDNVLILTTTFSGPALNSYTGRNFNYYISRSKSVSSVKYDVTSTAAGSHTAYDVGNQYQLQYDLISLAYAGFTYNPGDTVYVKTCVAPLAAAMSTWFNYVNYQSVSYPYLGDSTITSFVWPH